MTIEYKNIHDFTEEQLKRLFLSVEWSSGQYPDKLVVAMKNFDTVYSAWDGNKLVGMLCAMDDGIMNAYIHYLLVDPEYQNKAIGKTLIEMAKKKYQNYLRVGLIGYNDKRSFYEKNLHLHSGGKKLINCMV